MNITFLYRWCMRQLSNHRLHIHMNAQCTWTNRYTNTDENWIFVRIHLFVTVACLMLENWWDEAVLSIFLDKDFQLNRERWNLSTGTVWFLVSVKFKHGYDGERQFGKFWQNSNENYTVKYCLGDWLMICWYVMIQFGVGETFNKKIHFLRVKNERDDRRTIKGVFHIKTYDLHHSDMWWSLNRNSMYCRFRANCSTGKLPWRSTALCTFYTRKKRKFHSHISNERHLIQFW